MSAKVKKTTDLTKVTSPQSHSKTYVRTPFDNDSGQDSFFDLTLGTLSYLISEMSNKHDLSSEKDAVVLYVQEVTKTFCRKFTSAAFTQSLTKGKTGEVKIYKHYAFVPSLSDSLPTASQEEIEVYHVLNATAKDMDKYEKDEKSYENSPIKGKLETIKKVFDRHEDRRVVVQALAEKMDMLTKLYSVGKMCPPMTFCDIKFPNPNIKEYGIMEKAGTKSLYEESTYDTTLSLKEKLEIVKKVLHSRIKQINSVVEKDKLMQKGNQLAPPEEEDLLPDPTEFLQELDAADIEAAAEQSMQEILREPENGDMDAPLPGGGE